MGISVDRPDRLTLASGAQVVRFQNVLAPHERINDVFDACYVPRTFHLTGDLDLHDIGVDQSVEKFMAAAEKYNPDIIGMSGMIMNGHIHPHIVLANADKSFGGHLEPKAPKAE